MDGWDIKFERVVAVFMKWYIVGFMGNVCIGWMPYTWGYYRVDDGYRFEWVRAICIGTCHL